jgi:hypothetical protein
MTAEEIATKLAAIVRDDLAKAKQQQQQQSGKSS